MKAKPLLQQLPVLSALLIILTCMNACKKNDGGPGTIPDIPVDDAPTYSASIRGVVVNENDQPVAGATVTSGSSTATTDNNGVFRFNNIQLSAANGSVKVSKNGYFTGVRSFKTISGRIHNIRLKLLPKTSAGNFLAASGGTVSLASGGKLVIPAGAISDGNGNPYSGTVDVAMTWINPTSPDLPDIIMGDLRGITTDGIERGLQTFGMLGVELKGGTGQSLNLSAGKTAELTFPIPTALQGNAPATIDLWHFDEATARWKQEGAATKSGSNYIGTVSHFSFWNCDAPFPLAYVCMKLFKSPGNEPLNNVSVRIRKVSDNSAGYGFTDSLGNICGAVPKNEPLVLEVLGPCYNAVASQNIGPFSDNADIGDIAMTIEPSNYITINGKLTDCNNVNVSNGAVYISMPRGYSYSAPISNGDFSISVLNCNSGNVEITATGVNYATLQQGQPIVTSTSTGSLNLGTIQACGTTAEEYLQLSVDGSPINYIVPADSLVAYSSGGSGGYAFSTNLWAIRRTNSNSFNLDFNNNAAPGIYPVTNCFIQAGGSIGTSQQIVTASPVVTITSFAAYPGFIQGSFVFQMNFSGTTKNVTGNFKTRGY